MVAVLLYSATANAYDFEVDGIYYNILSAGNLTAEVTNGDKNYSGNVTIPSTVTYKSKILTVTSIGDKAFRDCSGLTSVIIGNSVTSIGQYAFYNCSGLTSFIIGNSVTSIGQYAFYNCSGLTSFIIPNSVTSIGVSAFSGCSRLTSFIIGNSVTSIGESAFRNCSGLTSVIIPNSVTSIGQYAFHNCSGLTSVIIGNNVTSIGLYAFYDCDKLKTVINLSKLSLIRRSNDHGSVAYYANRVINAPNGYVDGDFVWLENETGITLGFYVGSETDLTLPAEHKGKSITSIGDKAFYNCSGLTSVIIGNNVTSIGVSAFNNCSGLTSVIIPNSVTSIGQYAFHNCSGLTSIYVLGETPPSIGTYNFTENQYINITLYVPVGALGTYQNAEIWKNFWDIREVGATETPEEEVKKCATPVITYNDNGLDITSETDGAEIHTDITCNDVNSYSGDRIDLSATYNITTYVTKSGYLNSETVTATLCWMAVSGDSENNSIIKVEAIPVLITCNNGTINICGGKEGAEVIVYTTSGATVGNATITNGNAVINTSLTKGEIAIVNIAGKSIKIVI
ncbi:MAG: leucine-rich repeat domain-containing protein [Bacteroidales bacterium]|nr:leucine-rich repeat domain-containing protein [Bacteroidales bacterium]